MNNANFKKPGNEIQTKSGSSPKPKKSDFKRKNVDSKKNKKKLNSEKTKKQIKTKSKRKIKSKNLMRDSLDFDNTNSRIKGGKSPRKVKFNKSNKFIGNPGQKADELEKKIGKNSIPLSSKRKKSKVRKEKK